jgi:hypothetical protein
MRFILNVAPIRWLNCCHAVLRSIGVGIALTQIDMPLISPPLAGTSATVLTGFRGKLR